MLIKCKIVRTCSVCYGTGKLTDITTKKVVPCGYCKGAGTTTIEYLTGKSEKVKAG